MTALNPIRSRLDDTLVVEAAAGTGKTTELVARIVALVTTGRARITQIVAVTFSEKAAGELKLRLREELEAARRAAHPGSETAARLDAAVLEFEESHVSTIHGFCAELLRERPVEAGVDPAFDVLTEPAGARIYDEAFGEWIEGALQNPDEGVRRSLRRRRPPPWRGEPADEADGPIERLRRAGRDLLQWRDHRAPWTAPAWAREATIDHVVESVRHCAEMTADPIYRDDSLSQDTAGLRRMAQEIARAARPTPRDYDGLEALLALLSIDRDLKKLRKGRGAMYSTQYARQTVFDACVALREALGQFRDLADADLASHLHAELQPCLENYERRKQRVGALDFLDLLIRARDLVRDAASVRAAFQARFTHILVDEFQDTDPLQAELLVLLASDSRTGKVRPGALFVVGDPKQSIYRFRRADIGIYQQIRDRLEADGAHAVVLQKSYRSVRNIQTFVNAAFHGVMVRDDESLQPGYVALARHRDDFAAQPSVVALPVPSPYSRFRITKTEIERSLPDAIGEFVRWVVSESQWRVSVPGGESRPVRPSDVCLLFRRFLNYRDDATQPYVAALESRSVPHLLVGGKTFHEREEVDAVRTALRAIEWPEDELSVFATLRGPLFALGDEELLEYHARVRGEGRGHVFHPYRVPDGLPPRLQPIGDALATLRELHAGRNYRPVADTIGRLLQATRAHAGFMLWRNGEQVLANVLHVSELARQYETGGGLSFRGFIDTLREAADRADSPEAPILEEGSEGVRLMTVHKAKGLEFPIVVLADITCGLSREKAQRHLDTRRELCAMKLGGWAPLDLLNHNDLEARRDAAEGARLAYVAATRARDVLVVPAIGDGLFEDSWVAPLGAALYPPPPARRSPGAAAGVPAFTGKDTVLNRPDSHMAGPHTMSPGAYRMAGSSPDETFEVVWWDPALLVQPGEDAYGLRRQELIDKQAPPEQVAADRAKYDAWKAARAALHERASRPSMTIATATEFVKGDADHRPTSPGEPAGRAAVVMHDASVPGARPGGRRFGVLVHALLAHVPLDGTPDEVRDLAALHARVLGATDEERDAAHEVVIRALAHPLLGEARKAAEARRGCRREAPISFVRDGVLIDGQIDLAFESEAGWTVVDFKTDAELGAAEDVYRRQVALYAEALSSITGRPATGAILRL